jgi:hypothetical protein
MSRARDGRTPPGIKRGPGGGPVEKDGNGNNSDEVNTPSPSRKQIRPPRPTKALIRAAIALYAPRRPR